MIHVYACCWNSAVFLSHWKSKLILYAYKNTVPGDVSAMVPWLRLCLCDSGTPALTSRGFVEDDYKKLAEYFDAAVKIALQIKENSKGWFYILAS